MMQHPPTEEDSVNSPKRGTKMKVVRTDKEIKRVRQWIESGGDFEHLTYAEGVQETLAWLCGEQDLAPCDGGDEEFVYVEEVEDE